VEDTRGIIHGIITEYTVGYMTGISADYTGDIRRNIS
jgi:hypothetical protein